MRETGGGRRSRKGGGGVRGKVEREGGVDEVRGEGREGKPGKRYYISIPLNCTNVQS